MPHIYVYEKYMNVDYIKKINSFSNVLKFIFIFYYGNNININETTKTYETYYYVSI